MKKLIILLIVSFSLTAYGDISFKTEDEKEKYNSFTDTEFSSRMDQINGFLDDFKKITEKYLKEKHGRRWNTVYSREGVKGVKNTDWEMQTIGFSNIPRYISGSFLKKSYENALLKFKLAGYRYKSSEIDEKELNIIREELKKAEKAMKSFIENLNYVD